MNYTPETLTWEVIKSWDGPTMRDQMMRPEIREAIQKIAASRSYQEVEDVVAQIQQRQPGTPESEIARAPETTVATGTVELPAELTAEEQAAQYEAERAAAAAAQQAARQAAEQAENEQLRAAGITVQRDQNSTIVKYVQDYQVADDNGNPIGRPTHLEAKSLPELVGKQREAHSQATRAFHRLKSQKITFQEQQQVPAIPDQMSDAELLAAMKDLKSDDPQKNLDAIRKVQKIEADRVRAEKDAENAKLAEVNRQMKVSFEFRNRHRDDFNPCQANIKRIQEYFEENQLAWTSDNLEIAFHALESELAPVESVVSTVTVNPVPAAPATPVVSPAAVATVIPAAQPAVQPVVTAPAQPTAAANPQTVQPRPGVNGGLVPGQATGSRPAGTNQPKGLTWEELNSWDGKTMRMKMRDPRVRPQIEALIRSKNEKK